MTSPCGLGSSQHGDWFLDVTILRQRESLAELYAFCDPALADMQLPFHNVVLAEGVTKACSGSRGGNIDSTSHCRCVESPGKSVEMGSILNNTICPRYSSIYTGFPVKWWINYQH